MVAPSNIYPYASPAAPDALHVLLVEDNEDSAFLMRRLLSRMGHEVSYAADGLSALAQARCRPPHVVLLDISLPDVDGYEVAARLRATPGAKPPFIVALSGYECDEGLREESGIDLYLVKPAEPEVLGRVLGRFWRVIKGVLTEVGL
jgi:CheY-like chemotaxis protein